MKHKEITAIYKTNNAGLLAVVESVLTGAEIPYFVRGGEAASLMPINATIVVPTSFAEAATALIREAEQAHDTD